MHPVIMVGDMSTRVLLMHAAVLATVNLYFVAQSGTKQLAAASLGTSIAIMFGKLVLLGLCGALDTQASQVLILGGRREGQRAI